MKKELVTRLLQKGITSSFSLLLFICSKENIPDGIIAANIPPKILITLEIITV
jgi:hypothetical protein